MKYSNNQKSFYMVNFFIPNENHALICKAGCEIQE